MKKKSEGTLINILGKPYQIKCPEEEASALQRAAEYLEQKMRNIRETTNMVSMDRVAVIAALNITHQLLSLENHNSNHNQSIQQRLRDLQNKVDKALTPQAEMELQSAE